MSRLKPRSGGTNLVIVQDGIRAVMKRFLIFAILGPPLGFITVFWGMLQIANWATGHPLTIEARQILLPPYESGYAALLAPPIACVRTTWLKSRSADESALQVTVQKGTKAFASKTSGAGQEAVRGSRLNFAGSKFR